MTDIIAEEHLTQGELSPFIPGTNVQYAWDSSSLGMFKTCPRLYQYVMVEGWGATNESIHLRFGQEYHTALQDYDISRAAGIDHQESVFNVMKDLMLRTGDYNPEPDTKAGKYKSRFNLLRLVLDYLDNFENDVAETLVLENGRPAVELSFRFEIEHGPQSGYEVTAEGYTKDQQYPYVLCGHLDRVADFNGQLLIFDHKTTLTTISQHYFAQYEPNNQMTLYTFAGQVVLHTPIKGVCITAAQILLTEPNKFVRGFTYRTPGQIDEWMKDLQVTLDTAETYAIENYWPMNDTACDKFGGCKFRDICNKDPEVRPAFLKSKFKKLAPEEKWNPLRSR